MRQRKIRGVFINFMLLIISSVAAVAVLEIALSIGSYFFYPRLSVTDEALGWKYGHTPKKLKRHFAGVAHEIYINKDGFRDDEFTGDRDCCRIMVLGDSMTFGMRVDQEEIFCSLLEKKIKEAYPGKKIDVMNLGVPGFGTGQELLCLRKYAGIYPPDAVILVLFEGNDFDDNMLTLSEGRYVPHFMMVNGELLLCNAPRRIHKVLAFLRDKSVLFYLLQEDLSIARRLVRRGQAGSRRDKIVLACRILDEMAAHAKSTEAPFFVFYIKNRNFHNQRFEATKRHCMNKDISIKPIPFRPEERVPGDWHWNSNGHISVAEIIYDELSKRKAFDF